MLRTMYRHIISYYIVGHLKRQNGLKVGKVKMESVSDDDVRKRLNSQVLIWRRKVYSDWEDVTSSGRAFQVFGSETGKERQSTVDRLTGGTRRRFVSVERSDRLPGKLHAYTATLVARSKTKVRRCTRPTVKNSESHALWYNRIIYLNIAFTILPNSPCRPTVLSIFSHVSSSAAFYLFFG